MSYGYNTAGKMVRQSPVGRRNQLMADNRSWMFVLNNPARNDIPKSLKDLETVYWQREEGTRKIPHLQGVVTFKYPKSFGQVRRMIPKAWWSVMLGSIAQAVAYCTKERTRIEGPWGYHHISADILIGSQGLLALRNEPLGSSHHAHISQDTVVQPCATTNETAAPAVSEETKE